MYISLVWLYSLLVSVSIIFGLKLWQCFIINDSVLELSLGDKVYALWFGLRFDLAIAAFVALVMTAVYGVLRISMPKLWHRYWFFIFICILAVIIFGHCGNLIYFLETGRFASYEVVNLYNDFTGLVSQSWHKYKVIMLSSGILLALLLLAVSRLSRYTFPYMVARNKSLSWFKSLVCFLLILVSSVFFVRGGLKEIPLSPLDVYAIGNNAQAVVATNANYNILFAWLSNAMRLSRLNLPRPKNSVVQVMRELYPLNNVNKVFLRGVEEGEENKNSKHKNVIVILLESWSIANMHPAAVVTPQYVKLRQQGLSARLMLAGGYRTTEGLFSVFCSWQNPLGASVAHSQLQNNSMLCLPHILARHGYTSMFIQGSFKNTSGVGSLANKFGFAASYGLEDIDTRIHPLNAWGVHDPDIYNFVLDKIEDLQQPFLVGINTNTTHDLALPRVEDNVFTNKVWNVLHFSDKALGQFLVTFAFKYPQIYARSLFVILSDHTGGVKSINPLALNAIPHIFLAPDIEHKVLDRVVSQRDVAPTILDYLGLNTINYFAGKSLLSAASAPYFADFYLQGKLAWVEGNKLSITNLVSDSLHCFVYDSSLSLMPQPCSNGFRTMQDRALSFTRVSQEALFDNVIRENYLRYMQ